MTTILGAVGTACSRCTSIWSLWRSIAAMCSTATPSALSFPALNGGACRAQGQEIGKSTTFTPNRPDPQPSLGGSTQPEVEDAQGSDRLRELMTTRQTTGTVIPRSPPAIGRNEDGTIYLIEDPNPNPLSTAISNAMSLFNQMR